jgi:hypothetical protein
MFLFNRILILGTILLISACGGGGSSSSTTSTTSSTAASGFTSSYSSSGSIGEVLTYVINTSNLTYTYTVTQSAFGLTGTTGSGTLISNTDGSYTPSGSPNSKVFAVNGGLLVGGVNLTINGTSKTVPILGVNSPITTLANLAGTYNYIGYSCATNSGTISSPNCGTSYGTIKILSTGAYTTCTTINITTTTTCSTTTGTITALSGTSGTWKFARTGSTSSNYLIAYAGGNSQNVLLIDTNDSGGYGFGHTLASTQVAISSSDVGGTYHVVANDGTIGTTVPTATSYAFSGKSSGTNITTAGTLTINSPWNGLIAVTPNSGGGGTAVVAGSGLYAFRPTLTTNPYFEIGAKAQ